MKTFRVKHRVTYAKTDQMGVVYHGNYAEFYEIGRAEMMRSVGYPYIELENRGIQMPILDLHSKFIGSAKYDEVITIEAIVYERLKGVRIRVDYKIYNEEEKLINEGYTTLCCIDAETKRPVRIPNEMWESLGFHEE